MLQPYCFLVCIGCHCKQYLSYKEIARTFPDYPPLLLSWYHTGQGSACSAPILSAAPAGDSVCRVIPLSYMIVFTRALLRGDGGGQPLHDRGRCGVCGIGLCGWGGLSGRCGCATGGRWGGMTSRASGTVPITVCWCRFSGC